MRGKDLEKMRKKPVVEPKIGVHARYFRSSGLVDHLPYPPGPGSECGYGIHLGGAKFRISQNGMRLIRDVAFKDVIQRGRRIDRPDIHGRTTAHPATHPARAANHCLPPPPLPP